jgi:hypothetical protein
MGKKSFPDMTNNLLIHFAGQDLYERYLAERPDHRNNINLEIMNALPIPATRIPQDYDSISYGRENIQLCLNWIFIPDMNDNIKRHVYLDSLNSIYQYGFVSQ